MKLRIATLAAALALFGLVAPLVHAEDPGVVDDGWRPRAATFGVHVQKDVRITMSDGTVLAADIHRPAQPDGTPAPGRFPTLLVQTPYNKNVQNPANPYLVRRGYVDVVVDIRGTGSSEGAFDSSFSPASQRDGYELVRWAARQPWSTGRVGTHGTSYYAINQLLTAVQQPPELRAIFPVVPTGDNYRTNFPGGYLTSLFPFATQNAANGLVPPGYTVDDPLGAARSMGAKAAGVVIQGTNAAGLLAGDDKTYDGPAYRSISPLWLLDRIEVPTFLVGGWFDALSQRDVPMMFQGLQRRKVPVKMLMGAWYHTTPGDGLPVGGLRTLDELQLRWFDRWVRGDADPALARFGPVFYERIGDGTWHTAPTWPLPGVTHRKAYLGGSSSPGVAGTLSGAPPATAEPDVLPWHPLSGACTRSTYIGTFGLVPATPCETDDRANDLTGLTYDLPAHDESVDLVGPVSARLFVSTTRADAFVTIRVESIDPATGAAEELTAGWDSLSFRALDDARSTKVGQDYVIPFHPYTRESVRAVEPGKIYEWWIEIRPIAARIPAGHTLRVSIQPSDSVRFLPTARRTADAAGGLLRLHHDLANPSAILLPVATEISAGARGR